MPGGLRFLSAESFRLMVHSLTQDQLSRFLAWWEMV